MIKLGSFIRGIAAVKLPYCDPRPGWAFERLGRQPYGISGMRRRFWCELWTPAWHQGRGPYISVGFGLFAIYRGY